VVSASFEATSIPFSKLQLGKSIGVGTFGQVWAAEYLGATVAVKGAHLASLVHTEQTRSAFLEEAKLHVTLRHPNIVHMLGVSFQDDNVYLVMEYMPSTLFELLRQDKLSLKQRYAILVGVCAGMYFLHSSDPPVLHRDLKSLNVLVDAYGTQGKLCDFGLAVFKSQVRTAITSGKSIAPVASAVPAARVAGSVVGSYPWMAPETMQAKPFTSAADIFSLGVIIWELLSGKEPWEHARSADIIRQEVLAGIRLSIPNEVHPGFQQLVQQCWNPDPSARPSAKTVFDQVSSIVKSLVPEELLSPRFSPSLAALPQSPSAAMLPVITTEVSLVMRSLVLRSSMTDRCIWSGEIKLKMVHHAKKSTDGGRCKPSAQIGFRFVQTSQGCLSYRAGRAIRSPGGFFPAG